MPLSYVIEPEFQIVVPCAARALEQAVQGWGFRMLCWPWQALMHNSAADLSHGQVCVSSQDTGQISKAPTHTFACPWRSRGVLDAPRTFPRVSKPQSTLLQGPLHPLLRINVDSTSNHLSALENLGSRAVPVHDPHGFFIRPCLIFAQLHLHGGSSQGASVHAQFGVLI